MKYILTCSLLSILALAYSAEQSQINPDKRFDRKNRRHGVWEFYHDGNVNKLASKGTFRHGYQVKTWTYYDTLGRLEKTEKKTFLNPKIRTKMYYANGQVKKSGYARVRKTRKYIDYFWTGKWKCYDENGNYVRTEKYRKGALQE